MNQVFETLGRRLPESGVPFLMIGGHAVNYYGYTRATADIDFMITAQDIPAVREVMRSSGFSNISEGDTVIFFSHPESPFRVDLNSDLKPLCDRFASETVYAEIAKRLREITHA